MQRIRSCVPDEEVKQMQSIVAAHRKRLPNKQPAKPQVKPLYSPSVVIYLMCLCTCSSCTLCVSR